MRYKEGCRPSLHLEKRDGETFFGDFTHLMKDSETLAEIAKPCLTTASYGNKKAVQWTAECVIGGGNFTNLKTVSVFQQNPPFRQSIRPSPCIS